MKKVILLLLAITGLMISCSKKDRNELAPLTSQEKVDLRYLREEEKLARDVYRYAYEKYQFTTFQNISLSEQQHMDMVLALLQRYNIEDPVGSNQDGVFSNASLQQLYHQLVAGVDESLTDALGVGATIEDLDISDIADLKKNTSASDILAVYDNLMCGSRNHMRGFTTQIALNMLAYTPQFISQEEYENIISSPNEKCGTVLINF